MPAVLNRQRAAVICFGGWGLQTMLHLYSRLQYIQLQRDALKISYDPDYQYEPSPRLNMLPSLKKTTAFMHILPHVLRAGTSDQRDRPFSLTEPYGDIENPFYVEETIVNLVEGLSRGKPKRRNRLTEGEDLGELLFKKAYEDGYLQMVYPTIERISAPEGSIRWKRKEVLKRGTEFATEVTASLMRVIDRTRIDEVQPFDSFVQTRLYIIASLAEPLVLPLLWPFVSELVAQLGGQNVAKVVGMLATGSFALDRTHQIEEASVYTSLRELEALTSNGDDDKSQQSKLREKLDIASGWFHRLGHPLFDVTYILDSEKYNQGRAQNTLEHSVLAGNAVEAFLTSEADDVIERALGARIER